MMRSDTLSRTSSTRLPSLGLAALSLGLLVVAGCSSSSDDDVFGGTGGGSSGGASGMFVETCSLGCSSGQGGAAVNCTIDSIRQNQEIAIVFSQPVDIGSVNSTTFQVQNVATGAVPQGTFQVDASNPRRLVFRPSLSFDTSGQLVLGFTDGDTYRVTIPGSDNDSGPFIRSTSGRSNRSRLRCDVQPSGIADVVPGRPTVELFVDVQLFDAGNNPIGILPNQPADGQVDVSQFSPIKMVFADIMNPLTLFNPSTGTSNFIQVNIDRDGNPATVADQSPLGGTFSILIDQSLSRTELDFIPTCIPGPGLSGRQIVVRFLPGVSDLAGQDLIPPGLTVFAAEGDSSTATVLPDGGESFTDFDNFDAERSGMEMWGGGRLVGGQGGGAGRMGVLRVGDGETFVLDTEMQTFPADSFPAPGLENDIISNLIPGVDYNALNQGSWPKITVTDGVFEFSKIEVDVGGTLVIEGDRPAVLLSRGEITINGTVQASGESAPMKLASIPTSEVTAGGPNGGDGGIGGTRYDASAFFSGGAVQGPARPINLNCGAMDTPCPPGTIVPDTGDNCCLNIPENLDGQPGEEVGQGDIPAEGPPPTDSNGLGGVHWPTTFPISPSGGGLNDLIVDDSGAGALCRSFQVGGPGAGGGYALDGGAGIPITFPEADGSFNPLNLPPATTGGSAVGLNPPNPQTGHFVRRLTRERGHLRGGSGGGGGGTNLFNTGNKDPFDVFPCAQQGNIWEFYDNAGASGGGGGGGLQLTSGATLTVNGQVDASGGDGGSASALPPADTGGVDRRNATPGGGGSGGSLRLQAMDIELRDFSGRLDVRGGAGGSGVAGSTGGEGSRGLVRLEQPAAAQTNPDTQITRESEREKIEPYDESAPEDSDNHLSVGRWALPRTRPETLSGATSCWMQAQVSGCFFELAFEEDDDGGTPGDPSDDTFGWNMDIIYDDGSGEQIFPYRGVPNDPNFPLLSSIEDTTGNLLGSDLAPGSGSVLVVRFQGAQSKELQLTNRCGTELTGPFAEIVPGSLTPWVPNPAMLNDFVPVPNMIRFTIIWDRSVALTGSFNDFIKGVTNLRINAIPD